jgi:hypothetical protein
MLLILSMISLVAVRVFTLDLNDGHIVASSINGIACKTTADCPFGAACGGAGKCHCLIGFVPNSLTPTGCVSICCTNDADCVKKSTKHANKYACDKPLGKCGCNSEAGYAPDEYGLKCKKQPKQISATEKVETITTLPTNGTQDDATMDHSDGLPWSTTRTLATRVTWDALYHCISSQGLTCLYVY